MFKRYNLFLNIFEPFALCTIDGEGGEGGGGQSTITDGGAGNGSAAMTREDWTNFFGSLTTEVKNGNAALAQRLDGLHSTVQKGSESKPQTAPEPTADEIDGMSNSEFGNFLMTRMQDFIKNTFSEGTKPLLNGLENLRKDYTLSSANAEVEKLRSTNKDFNDWNDEMVKLATEHPSLSIPQLLNLARAENPEKAKKLEAQYNPAPKRPNLFAATPGYGGLNGGSPDDSKPLTREQAGREALQEVAERHPILQALMANSMR